MFDVKIFTFSPVQENTSILWNEQKDAVIIDPGCYFTEEKDALAAFIDSNGLKPVLLLNTHCHLDHVFGNKWVADTYQLQLHIHPDEKALLDYAPTSGLMWNLPFDNYTGHLLYLREGDTLRLGADTLEVLFTPGHSPGSISFYCREQGFIVSGDVLFRQSIGRTDLPGGDYSTLERSIQQKLYTLPENTIVYPGHGDATTIGFEKNNNPFVTAES